MINNLLVILVAVICFIQLILYIWSKRHMYLLSLKLPGPISLPFIGCAYKFLFIETEDLFKEILSVINSYPKNPVIRFWLGPNLFLIFKDPVHVEKILISTKVIAKADLLKYLKTFAGEGLITGSGIEWKVARKHIQPLYGQKFVTESIGISNKHINRFMEKLMERVDKPKSCIHHAIHLCVADIIGEAILGVEIGAQKGRNKEFIDASIKYYDVVYPRLVKPWLQNDFIFSMSHLKDKTDVYKATMNKFMDSVVENTRRIKKTGKSVVIDNFKPSINDLDKIFMENSKVLNYQNYLHNLITLYAASEDTVAQIAAATCFCLGMYPECQEKATEEIRLLVGANKTNITFDDVIKLDYLDKCVKEALRLFPIAPFIARKVVSDFQIDKWTLPSNVSILISIFSLHLNPKEWEHPMEFYPEHFDFEAVEKRHPYSFIPFSAGPRGCIGKLYAQTSIKVLLVNILQRFKIEADGKYVDIYKHLRADISVRSKIGFPVKLTRRKL
ncbi:unnamed protein product [Brassicogethes aeneus]|uniref:Cytochrome P450 n=1 Tax=Brassicogethes aeneus TaxID=1431903 RepID=A0A9P0BAH4_BRAAE|nr:unnamed protein product [Brassicogethes aeneus]